MRRMVKAPAGRGRPVFIRLSVRGSGEDAKCEAWAGGGEQLNRFWSNLRGYCGRLGFDPVYYWELEAHADPSKVHYEFPHWHLVILGMPFIPAELLARWWGWGFIDVRLAETGDEGQLLRYLGKYCWKQAKEGSADLESLPRWWFFFRVFHRRHFGWSQDFRWQGLERGPAWLSKLLVEQGFDVGGVVLCERFDGCWRVGWGPGDSILVEVRYRLLKV
jgi:hypothetical protein